MDKAIVWFLVVGMYMLMNLIVAAEGGVLSFARYQMPKILRKMIFYIPKRYYKFTFQGICISVYSHILLLVSTIVIIFTENENWDYVTDTLMGCWVVSWFAYLGLFGWLVIINLFWGEKKVLKKAKIEPVHCNYEFIRFDDFKVIKEAVVSDNITQKINGVVLMLPSAVGVDYEGIRKYRDMEDDVGSCGNYEEMSRFFNEEGYATIRISFCEDMIEYGYFLYVDELKKVLKALNEKYKLDGRLVYFAHGTMGSVTALDILDEVKTSKLIMLGGVNVGPQDEMYNKLKFFKESSKEVLESLTLFAKEILTVESVDLQKRLETISVPVLAVYASEEIICNPELVEEFEKIDNSNITIKKLISIVGGLLQEENFFEYPGSGCSLEKDCVLTVSKIVKKCIKEWL